MLRPCFSVRRKTKLLVPIYLFYLTELISVQASGSSGIHQTSPTPGGSLLRATPAGVSAPPGGTLPPHQGKQHWRSSVCHHAAYLVCRPMVGESYCPSLAPCHHPAQYSTNNTPTRWTRYLWGRISQECPPPYDHPSCGSLEHAGLREHIASVGNLQLRPFTRNPLCSRSSQGR